MQLIFSSHTDRKRSLSLLIPLHQRIIMAILCISAKKKKTIIFCYISKRSATLSLFSPIFISFTRRIVMQPYEAILPAVGSGNGKRDKIYNILQSTVK